METSYKVENQSDHDQVMRLINDRKKPNAILRLLMNAFEGYRQSKKLGWSRPWNKYNLTNFQSFKVYKEKDQDLIAFANRIVKQECSDISIEALEFADYLMNECDSLMAFIFLHDYVEEGQKFEGATLSLGCKNNKRYRDRIDIIVESPVIDGVSQGFERMRVYIDPYTAVRGPMWSGISWPEADQVSSQLFDRLSAISSDWQAKKECQWNHWTSDYIDYFGPRKEFIQNSFFFQGH